MADKKQSYITELQDKVLLARERSVMDGEEDFLPSLDLTLELPLHVDGIRDSAIDLHRRLDLFPQLMTMDDVQTSLIGMDIEIAHLNHHWNALSDLLRAEDLGVDDDLDDDDD